MSRKLTPPHDLTQLRALLISIRADFDRLRSETPIRATLVHKATNVSHYGVAEFPVPTDRTLCRLESAGFREARQYFDKNGYPVFTDEAELDVNGNPITNSANEAFKTTMPASRQVYFKGDERVVELLRRAATRASQVLLRINTPLLNPVAGWRFQPDRAELWWSVLFEYAWTKVHPLLCADKYIWLPAGPQSTSRVPYDSDAIKSLMESPFGHMMKEVPQQWTRKLPDAYASELSDVAAACTDFADVVIGLVEGNTVDSRSMQVEEQAPAGKTRKNPRARPKREAVYPQVRGVLLRHPTASAKTVATEIGCSVGMVQGSPAWRANQIRLRAARRLGATPKMFPLNENWLASSDDAEPTGTSKLKGSVEALLDRIDKDQQGVHLNIGDYLKHHPNAGPSEIAAAVGCSEREVRNRQSMLDALIEEQNADSHPRVSDDDVPSARWRSRT